MTSGSENKELGGAQEMGGPRLRSCYTAWAWPQYLDSQQLDPEKLDGP